MSLRNCVLLSGWFLCVALGLLPASAHTMYVLTADWRVHIIDMQSLSEVDSFEVIQTNPPLVEERGVMSFGEFVPEKNLLFVSNVTGGRRGSALKIMKVDLSTRVSSAFFRDQLEVPSSGTLMPDAGDYYYDADDELLYAHYYDIVYALDKDGTIVNTFQDVPWLALDQSYPRFGMKVYRLGTGTLDEFDLATCTEREVLNHLEWIGGGPYAVGTKMFLSQSETDAEIFIADRETWRLKVTKSDTGPWTITSQEQWRYETPDGIMADVPGYKRFDGDLLTVTPGQGDLRFWVFDPSHGPVMSLRYLLTLPSPELIWNDVKEDPPRSKYNPTAKLAPGASKVIATYTSETFDRFRIVILDAETGQQLKVFDMFGGLAGIFFTQ